MKNKLQLGPPNLHEIRWSKKETFGSGSSSSIASNEQTTLPTLSSITKEPITWDWQEVECRR